MVGLPESVRRQSEPASAAKAPSAEPHASRLASSFGCGALVGTLGGLIGLGGAEFRLPLLISLFGFGALESVILNKAMSLVVVGASLPLRMRSVPFEALIQRWDVMLTLLTGSLLGAWLGAGWATRLRSERLFRVLAVMLVIIALVLLIGHGDNTGRTSLFAGPTLAKIGIFCGFAIGIFAAVMGVAGGELLIPTIILLFGADPKLAGSLSLAVSLPTMLVGFARYSRDQTFPVVKRERRFLLAMAAGSVGGSYVGSVFLGVIPTTILLPLLSAILLISAVKVWRHGKH